MILPGKTGPIDHPAPAMGAGATDADTLAKRLWGWVSKALLLIAVGAVCVIAQRATPVQAQAAAAACPPGHECPCTWSGWLNRDAPSATGDWEDLTSLVKEGKLKCRRPLAIQCRYRPNGPVWGGQVGSYPPSPTPPAGYSCLTAVGGICKNSKTVQCKDSEVRFCCLPE